MLRNRGLIIYLTALLLAFYTVPGGSGELSAHTDDPEVHRVFHRPEFKEDRFIPDVILVPEHKGWLISILLPYFSPGSNWLKLPDIFVVPEKHSSFCDRFLTHFRERRVLSFVSPEWIRKEYSVHFSRMRYISISDFPLKASLQLANAFAEKIPHLVVTGMKEPERFMRAAVFAGQYGLPLIPFQNIFDHNELNRLIREKQVTHAFLVTDLASQSEMFDVGFPAVSMSVSDVHYQTIRKLGRGNVRNLIATRPMVSNMMPRMLDNDMIHFVPYISLLRRAPVVLLDSAEGHVNEKTLVDFIERFGIRPRTLTVVGDNRLINTIELEDELQEQVFDHSHALERELLSRPEGENAFPFGVGRLPFKRLP